MTLNDLKLAKYSMTRSIVIHSGVPSNPLFRPVPCLECRGNHSATSNNMKLYWPLMGGLLHLVQRGETWTGCRGVCRPAQFLIAVPNVTTNLSRACVPNYQSPYCCIMVRCSAVLMCL